MILIRSGTFETNSSSMHSVSVATERDYDTILPTDPDEHVIHLCLDGYEFGWEYETYSDPITKLAYLLLDLDFDQDAISDAVQLVIDVVENQTRCTLSVTRGVDRYGRRRGYIDHQSRGTTESIRTSSAIRNFIFNPNSFIQTDNDNY